MSRTREKLREIEQAEPNIINIADVIGCSDSKVFAVCEHLNVGGSHKARAVARMLRKEFEAGNLEDGVRPIDYSTGSEACAVADIWNTVLGRVGAILLMPEDTTPERENYILERNAELILTPADRILKPDEKVRGIKVWVAGAVQRAAEIAAENPNTLLLNQSVNRENNRAFHHLGAQIAFQKPDYVISACGTGATIVGLGEMIKKISPDTKMIATEPTKSASAWTLKNNRQYFHAPHVLLGTGPGSHPPILKEGIEFIDWVYLVDDEEAYEECNALAHKFMLSGVAELAPGPSSLANVMAARQILRFEPDARVFVIFHDQAKRYGSRGIAI